jgi:hypothetical protein
MVELPKMNLVPMSFALHLHYAASLESEPEPDLNLNDFFVTTHAPHHDRHVTDAFALYQPTRICSSAPSVAKVAK